MRPTARTAEGLDALLRRLDGGPYPAYQDLTGRWDMGAWTLAIDHVQGDPYAPPSRLRALLPATLCELASAWSATPPRRLALEDLLARRAAAAARRASRPGGSGGSGRLHVDAGGQEVLERSACRLRPGGAVELRLSAGLPAAGRRVRGDEARRMLLGALPEVARAAAGAGLALAEAEAFVACVENQEAIRAQLAPRGLIAFVADGARLPRASGASDLPLADAVPFASPPTLRVTLEVPNPVGGEGGPREVAGMGLPRGVTLVVGGGYHGKSTLLQALQRGVYPHVPSDGRELVVADPGLVKVRAEDGRAVRGVDIAPYIADLPDGRDTRRFDSDDASGSTSQAAAVAEALEVGATGLLMDEDTCATNFMVRDARMQALVATEAEPITPFVDRVRQLWEERGVSTVLVMGGSGDYLDHADLVLRLRAYRPEDATAEARRVARAVPTGRRPEAAGPLPAPRPRAPEPAGLDPRATDPRGRIRARELRRLRHGRTELALDGLEQLVDESQTRALAGALRHLAAEADGRRSLAELLAGLERLLDEGGVDRLGAWEGHPGDLARPRRYEVAMAVNRLRTLTVRDADAEGA